MILFGRTGDLDNMKPGLRPQRHYISYPSAFNGLFNFWNQSSLRHPSQISFCGIFTPPYSIWWPLLQT